MLGGFNPYGYVFDPTGWVDPLGLKGCTTSISDNDDYDVVLELDKQEHPEAFGHIDDYLNGKIKGHSPSDGVFTLDRRGDNKANVQDILMG
ncbi:TPA: hypothetical protein QB352_002368 [Pasteurella multocida]|nr:hypothetical protein [Pasteurella multocida]